MHGCPLHTIFCLTGRQPPRRMAARLAARRVALASDGPPRTRANSAAAVLSLSAGADGAGAYTDDCAPRSPLATLSLCTTTPPPVRAWQPGTAGLLPIPCSIVRHKPTTRAALEPNKSHRSDHIVGPSVCTEVALSHIRNSLGSTAAMGHPATVTRYIVIRNDPHRGSLHRCKIFIVAGNRPWTVRTARFWSLHSVIDTRPSMFRCRALGPAEYLAMVTNVTSDSSGARFSTAAEKLQSVTGITSPPAPRTSGSLRQVPRRPSAAGYRRARASDAAQAWRKHRDWGGSRGWWRPWGTCGSGKAPGSGMIM